MVLCRTGNCDQTGAAFGLPLLFVLSRVVVPGRNEEASNVRKIAASTRFLILLLAAAVIAPIPGVGRRTLVQIGTTVHELRQARWLITPDPR